MEDCDATKALGNAAIKASDFAAAEEHYTRALSSLPQRTPNSRDADTDALAMRITLLCNRAQARHQRSNYSGAAADATEALELLPDGLPGTDVKMRVKALYRRALSREAAGDLRNAFLDVNLALKLAPTNDGLVEAGKRLKAALPAETPLKPQSASGCLWTATHPHDNWYVLPIVDSEAFPGRLRGYSEAAEDPVLRFANGMGVQVHCPEGVLRSIQAFCPPRIADKEILNVFMKDFHLRPNFAASDGLIASYSSHGDLQSISVRRNSALNGPFFTFTPAGNLDNSKSGVYVDDELDSSIISIDFHNPGSVIARALVQMVVPVKKALDIGLSPGEQKLCVDLRINTDYVQAAELNRPAQAATEHEQWAADRKRQPLDDNLLVIGGTLASYPDLPENLRGASC